MTEREWPNPKAMGHAHWMYDDQLDMHIPCCSRRLVLFRGPDDSSLRTCGNGPLTGDQIDSGDCGEHAL